MQITFRTLILLTVLLGVTLALAYTSYTNLPNGDVSTSLFETMVTGASLIVGGLVTALSVYSEQRRNAATVSRRKTWALRRMVIEIVDGMHAAESMISNPMAKRLTLLPDDVWVTSRTMIADQLTCDPTHYALTDYYKTLRVLQISEEERLKYVLTGGECDTATEIVADLASTIISIGKRTIELLIAYDPTLESYAVRAAVEDDAYREAAHREAVKQVSNDAA